MTVTDGGQRRRDAIAVALAASAPGDVVAVLGKGHERGQQVAGRVLPFADEDAIREVWAELAARAQGRGGPMIPITVGEVARLLGAEMVPAPVVGSPDPLGRPVSGLVVDSRRVDDGSLSSPCRASTWTAATTWPVRWRTVPPRP